MKKIINDARLMIKVCDLYYNRNISQQKITEMLGISRPTVSKLLVSAREQGIVKITVSGLDTIRYWEMERELMEQYHLQDVLITDSGSDLKEMKKALGRAAARYLEYNIKDDDIVGIAMGSTLHGIIPELMYPSAENVTFIPLLGGLGQLRMELHSNNLAGELARIYKGKFVPMYAPARVSNAMTRAGFMKEESMNTLLKLMKKLDVAIVGIGFPNENSSIKATGYFKENEIESLIERKVAGEICMQFYDVNGDEEAYQNDNNVIGMELSRLKKVPRSIGVAGGIEKVKAIQGAIRGNYINTLITDYQCANALIQGGI